MKKLLLFWLLAIIESDDINKDVYNLVNHAHAKSSRWWIK